MKIRPAQASDVPAIAAIGAEAFEDEPIYAQFFPRRGWYPADYKSFFAHDVKRMLVTPGQHVAVAEAEESDKDTDGSGPSPGTIVGYATFIRSGTTKQKAMWNEDSLSKRIQRLVLYVQETFRSYFWPNRAIEPRVIEDYYSQAFKIHAETGATDKLDFKTLAVSPAHQRRGIGEELVKYCGMKAYEDGVLVFGDASTKGLPLYLRVGCKEIGRIQMKEQLIQSSGTHEGFGLPGFEIVVLKWDPASF